MSVAINKSCHCITADGVYRTVRPILPPISYTSRMQPGNLSIETAANRNIPEWRSAWHHILWLSCISVEKRCHCATFYIICWVECAIRVSSSNTLRSYPLNLLIKWHVFMYIVKYWTIIPWIRVLYRIVQIFQCLARIYNTRTTAILITVLYRTVLSTFLHRRKYTIRSSIWVD